MVLIEHQIDLVKVALESINHKFPDQVQAVNQIYQEHLTRIGSDGSFLQLDYNGVVKLFETEAAEAAEAADLQEQCVSTIPIGGPSLFGSESTSEGLADSEVVSEADGVCGSYQRPDITLYDRLQIAACFWDPERAWGCVASLAQKYGTSRQTIYQIASAAQRGLSAGRPGPKDKQIETSPSRQAEVPPADVQKDSTRERIILTSVFPGAVTMRPLEQILNQIPGINSCSDTTIWRIINQAGQDADRILSEVDYQQVKLPLVFVAVDETYFNGYPIFFAVEPISLSICGYYIPSDKDRSADSWTALLELVKNEQNLNFIGGLGDAAKAFPKAFKDLLGNEDSFGEDNFHLLYALNRLIKALERSAYSAMSQVESLITKWCDAKASEDQIESAEQESIKRIDLYDQFAEIGSWVRDGLEMIDLSSGEIRDSEINGWLLDLACSEMKKLKHKKVKKMSKRIKNHKKKLLKHLDWLKSHLSEPMNQLHQQLGDQEIESYLINLAARYWRVNHAIEGLKYRSLRPLAEQLHEEIEFWITGEQWLADWIQNLFQLFSSIQGTSSAVENINSILKPMIKNTALRVPLGEKTLW